MNHQQVAMCCNMRLYSNRFVYKRNKWFLNDSSRYALKRALPTGGMAKSLLSDPIPTHFRLIEEALMGYLAIFSGYLLQIEDNFTCFAICCGEQSL